MAIRARCVTFAIEQNVTANIEQYQKWAWIYHDKDIDSETGEIKKAHYHYFLEFGNARYLSGVAKEFEIPENMIEVVRNKIGILRYFTHSTEASKEKYEYDKSEVHSSFDYEQATENYDMLTIYDIIELANTPREAIKRVQAVGFTGNPLSGVSYIVKIWNEINKTD